MKREKTEYAIQAVDNVFDLLEQFKGVKGSFGITELSNNLGLHKNNVFRLLATLESKGYIEQDLNTEEYRLGIKSLELGRAFLNHTGLLKVLKPVLQGLMSDVHENVYLGLLKNNQIVYVEHVESNQVLRVTSRIGSRLSPLCTAVGKIMLGNMSTRDRDAVIDKNVFKKYTENTIMDRDRYIEDIAEAKKNGYAVDHQEYDVGVVCVGAPIFNYEKKVIAGISISGPSLRMGEDALKATFIPKIKEYSLKLSKSVGYVG